MDSKNRSFETADSDKRQDQRLTIVRQKRYRVSDDRVYFEAKGTRFQVFDYSAFGLALRPDGSSKFPKEVEGTFVFNDIEIGSARLRLMRVEKENEVDSKAAYEIVGEPLDILSVEACKLALETTSKHRRICEALSKIPMDFKHFVFDLKEALEQLKLLMEKIETDLADSGKMGGEDFLETIPLIVGRYLQDVVPPFYERGAKSLSGKDQETVKDCLVFFRERVMELLYRAPIVDRIYSKPLGYAGDFEMMNVIYKTTAEGRTLFDKCIHNLFVRDPAAEAVRNRAEYLCKKLQKTILASGGKKLKIMSLACGPAMELQILLERKLIPQDVDIELYLVDQDEEALRNANFELKIRIKEFPNIKISYLHKTMRQVITKGFEEKDFDLIYSAGVFDYFSDAVAQFTAQSIVPSLRQGGLLVIGNFSTSNPSKAVMELVLDWHLIYRSKEDLNRLFSHLGSDFVIETEDLGINLFCVLTK